MRILNLNFGLYILKRTQPHDVRVLQHSTYPNLPVAAHGRTYRCCIGIRNSKHLSVLFTYCCLPTTYSKYVHTVRCEEVRIVTTAAKVPVYWTTITALKCLASTFSSFLLETDAVSNVKIAREKVSLGWLYE